MLASKGIVVDVIVPNADPVAVQYRVVMSRSAQWFTSDRWLSKIFVLQSCAMGVREHHHAKMDTEDSGKSAPKNTLRRSPAICFVSDAVQKRFTMTVVARRAREIHF